MENIVLDLIYFEAKGNYLTLYVKIMKIIIYGMQYLSNKKFLKFHNLKQFKRKISLKFPLKNFLTILKTEIVLVKDNSIIFHSFFVDRKERVLNK